MDAAISGDRNVKKKEAMKILWYKNITLEVLRMRNLKTKVIPVIGVNATISKPDNTGATYRESTKLRNCERQPY